MRAFGQQSSYQTGYSGGYQNATYQPNGRKVAREEKSFLDKTENFLKDVTNDIQKVFVGEETKESRLTGTSLLDAPEVAPKSFTPTKKTFKKQALPPAKKFLKVSTGKPQPTPQEENALIEKLDPSMIQEFIAALEDSDWKVKVRAIRGLEICGDKYGYSEIFPVRPTINGFKGAPQLSLKKASAEFIEKLEKARMSQ
jgi:hypothetical protein